MNNPWIQTRAENLVHLSALMSCKGKQKKVDSWPRKSWFFNSEDQKDRSAMMREQFEATLFSCKHWWNDPSLSWGWGTTRLSACHRWVCMAQLWERQRFKGRMVRGCAGQENHMGELGFAQGLKESPRFGWADKDEKWRWDQRRGFGRCLWKT